MQARFFAGALALATLPLSLGAQVLSIPPGSTRGHATVTYDISTNSVTQVSAVRLGGPSIQAASALCFDNAGNGALYADVPLGQEWVDWGEKECSATGAMRNFEVGYGTTALDTSLGGPGASLELAVYQGTQGAFGILGEEIGRFSLTGLPASDGINAIGATVTVNLVMPLPSETISLQDGRIGWGYTSTDGVTGPLLVDLGTSEFGPDSYGYEGDAMPNGFEDIRGTGIDISSSLTLPGLQQGGVVSLDFPLRLYDQYYTEVTVSNGGHLVGGTTPNDYDLWLATGCFPNFLDFDSPVISPGMTDAIPDSQTTVHRLLRGTYPFRETVFQWSDLPMGCTAGQRLTMQAILFESTGAIEFHYEQAGAVTCTAPNEQLAKIGFKTTNGEGFALSCNDPGGIALDRSYRVTLGAEGRNGVSNLLNRYISPARPGSFVGSFVLLDAGGGIVPASSLHLRISEEDGSCGVAAIATLSTPNTQDVLSGSLPVLGEVWTGTIFANQFMHNYTNLRFYTSQGVCTSGCPTPWGDFLVDPITSVVNSDDFPPFQFGNLSRHEIPIPANIGLCGMRIFAQGSRWPGQGAAFEVTNALELTLGF